MANILPRERQLSVLHHLVEGNTLRSTTRLTGVHRTTIQNLLVDFGGRCQEFMDRELRDLTLNHVQCDEIWTFCLKKQSRLTISERAERHDIGDVYVWTSLDTETKLVPAFIVGKRSADNARKLMTKLADRLAMATTAPERRSELHAARLSTDHPNQHGRVSRLSRSGRPRVCPLR